METNHVLPYVIQDVSREDHQIIWDVTPEKRRYVQVGPNKYYYPEVYKELGPKYYNLALRPDDVFLVSHPRAGSTWFQEIIWLINNNLDYATAKSTDASHRCPLLDINLEVNIQTEREKIDKLQDEERREYLESYVEFVFDKYYKTTSQRFYKSHLPLSLLPPNLLDVCKVVYLARDPRDVFVSVYHLFKQRFYYDKPDQFWDLYRRGLTPWAPIFPHIKEAWAAREHPNLLFIFYEDILTDMPHSLRRLANFFGKKYTEEQIRALSEHLKFDNIKNNEAVNQQRTMSELGICTEDCKFMRKGKIGDWQQHFKENQWQEVNDWMRENLGDTDLVFPTFKY